MILHKEEGKPNSFSILLFTCVLIYAASMTVCCFAEDAWRRANDMSFRADIAFSKPLKGKYDHGTYDYDEGQDDVKITATGSLIDANGKAIKSFTNLPGILVHGEDHDYLQFDIDQFRLQIWDRYSGSEQEIFKKVLIRSSKPTHEK